MEGEVNEQLRDVPIVLRKRRTGPAACERASSRSTGVPSSPSAPALKRLATTSDVLFHHHPNRIEDHAQRLMHRAALGDDVEVQTVGDPLASRSRRAR